VFFFMSAILNYTTRRDGESARLTTDSRLCRIQILELFSFVVSG
jgi:hypothetical protein